MAVKDIRSDLQQTVASTAVIAGNGTTDGADLDTANFELGLMFTVSATDYMDGTFDFIIEEKEQLADSYVVVPSTSFIGTLAGLQITAGISNNDILNTIGVFSNKRFVRINTVATVVTNGATITIIATEKGEVLPV